MAGHLFAYCALRHHVVRLESAVGGYGEALRRGLLGAAQPLLGTGPVNIYGEPNPYFARRIDGAARLYAAHRIDTVLISGNHTGSYNEPAMMRAQLVKRGVPAAVIIEDGKGYNTFLSIDRARKVYGQRHFTIISQEFHNERAIYMARNAGLDCVGYNCGNYQARRLSVVRMYLRERLSRLKAVLLHAVGKQ